MDRELRDLLLSGVAARQTIIHFPNGEYEDIASGIYSGSMKLEEILSANEELNFGECNASRFEAKIANIPDISNLLIYVYQNIKYDENKVQFIVDRNETYVVTQDGRKIAVGRRANYTLPLFYGRVDTAELQTDRIHRVLTAYDELYFCGDINCATWYENFFKTAQNKSLKAFRDSLFSFIGIPQGSAKLINDDIVLEQTIETDAIKFADIIKAICQLNGVFGHIDRNGVFQYIDLSSAVERFDISDNYRSNDSKLESYTTKRIDKLQIRSDDEDIGAIVGTGTNPYIIQGNFLIYGKSASELTSIANKIFGKIKLVEYQPVDASLIFSEPYITVGNGLTFTTKRDEVLVNTFVLKNSFSGVQLFNQNVLAEGSEYRSEVVDDVNAEIYQLKGKTLKIIKNVDEFSVKIEDLEQGYSELKVTVGGITSTVEAQDGRISVAQQTADKINWLVKSGTSETNFTLTDRAIELVSENIDITGYVTFNDLESKGKTEINGANIMTGTISADKIKSLEVEVEDIYLDGTAVFDVASDGTVFFLADSSEEIYIGRKVILGDMTGKVGFFGSTGAKLQYVSDLSSSAALADVRSTVMDLVDALNAYGLISVL